MQNAKFELIDGAIRKIDTKRNRSRTEMALDFLRVCFKPSNMTTVMARANLDWTKTVEFSDSLMKKGLLIQERIDGHRVFCVTQEGKEAVFMWNKLRDVLQL